MENMIQFAFNLFDLGIFWYYVKSFKGVKNIPGLFKFIIVFLLAAIWTTGNTLQNPHLNILVLITALLVITMMFEGSVLSKFSMCISYLIIGIIIETLGYVIMQTMRENIAVAEKTLYYLMALFIEFARANIIYMLSKMSGKKRINIKAVPKEIIPLFLLLPILLTIICCLIMDIAVEANNSKSLILCFTTIIVVILSYYLMIFILERFTVITNRQHEEERYLDEQQFQKQFYDEIQEKFEYIQDLKHNIRNQFLECKAYLDRNDLEGLKLKISEADQELSQADTNMYSCNPVINSVLQVKFGTAKRENIAVSAEIMIPSDFNLEYGEIGVLYGNLLDNAIEACRKVEPDKRFITMKSRMMNGNLIIHVTNSKQPEKNEQLRTTKADAVNHGRGVNSIRKVVDKYDGMIEFEDKGETFEVTGILYEVG